MKKLFLSLCIIISGCASIPQMNRQIIITTLDFTKYTKNNFLITPEPYTGEYESVGAIRALIIPQIKNSPSYESIPGYYKLITGTDAVFVEIVNPQMAMDQLYTKADSMGANAIMNFMSIETEIQIGIATVPTYKLTGFAIKRK